MAAGAINLTDPVDWSHPLNVGRSLWLYGLPQWSGGNTWHDLCRRANAALVSAPTWAVSRAGDQGLSFSGSNYVSCGSPAYLDVTTGSFTVACWIRFTTTSSAFPLCKTTGPATNGYDILLNEGGVAGKVTVRVNGAGGVGSSYAGSLNDGLWHRLVGTRVGSTVSLYTDGVFRGSQTASGTLSNAAAPLQLGGRNGTAFAACDVADVSVWPTRGLSASDVARDYDQGLRGYPDLIRRVPARVWSDYSGGGGFSSWWSRRGSRLIGSGVI